MLHTSLLLALSLTLPVSPVDHHDKSSKATLRIEAGAMKNCRLIGRTLKYYPVVFGSPQIAEYRGVPFGSPAVQYSKSCMVVGSNQERLYYRPVVFGSLEVAEYRGDLFSTPAYAYWHWKNSRIAKTDRGDEAKRTAVGGAAQD